MTYTCGTCWREFPGGLHSREQHLEATGHWEPEFECDTCDRFFWRFECDDCYDAFSDEEDLREHEVEDHLYCHPCDRYFYSYHGIQQHLNSSVHRHDNQIVSVNYQDNFNNKVRRQEELPCPFCDYKHPVPDVLVQHLEQGCCPNAPLDRAKLYEAVQRRDPNGVITKKLLADSTPANMHYEATELAYNPAERSYECYLCGRLFRKLSDLNQHLASPKHQMHIYKCPNKECKKTFTTLAGLINHLESESCRYMRFEAVRKTAERIIDPRKMISL